MKNIVGTIIKVVLSTSILAGAVTLVSTSLIERNKPAEPEKPYVREYGDRGNTQAYVLKEAPRMRSCYTIDYYNQDDTTYYNLFRDSMTYIVGGSSIKGIFNENHLYLDVRDESDQTITITCGNYKDEFVGNKVVDVEFENQIEVNNVIELNYSKGNKNELMYFVPIENENVSSEFTRNLFTALYTDEVITVDAIKDDKYLESEEIDVSYQAAYGKTTSISAKVNILWNDTFLYAFYEVTDSDVDETSYSDDIGAYHENDCCELWISTCRTLPTQFETWGWDSTNQRGNRGNPAYCGEGGFKIRAGQSSITGGQEWMYDMDRFVTHTCSGAYQKTSKGYNCEFRIDFLDFNDSQYCLDKENQIIDIGILVSDGTNNETKGKVGSNYDATYVWAYGGPSHMDHLKLIK